MKEFGRQNRQNFFFIYKRKFVAPTKQKYIKLICHTGKWYIKQIDDRRISESCRERQERWMQTKVSGFSHNMVLMYMCIYIRYVLYIPCSL